MRLGGRNSRGTAWKSPTLNHCHPEGTEHERVNIIGVNCGGNTVLQQYRNLNIKLSTTEKVAK
jgi:hypothetical protein